MMIINSLDTNVVYDIVYTKRNRNSVAMDFYKKFRNLELTVTSTVKEECVKVLIKYSTMFATDLTNFLNGHNALGKHWDDIEVKGKSNLVNDFEKSIQNKSDYKVIHPFYQNIIKKIKQSIIFMNTENINGYLLELPATMQEYLLDSIDNMFTTILPNSIANGFMDTNKKFETLLKGYFNSNESSDLKILVTLIMLVIAGNSSKYPFIFSVFMNIIDCLIFFIMF